MSESAVLDAPSEVTPDTETVQPVDTEAEGVNAPAGTDDVQAEAQAEETTDPIKAAIAEGEKAEIETRARELAEQMLAQQKAEAPKQAVKAKHQEALAKAQQFVEDKLLDPDEAQPLFDLANAAHMEALEQARVAYNDAFYALGGDDFGKQFEGRTDPVTPEEMLNALVEVRALDSKAVKGLSLEDAIKKSPSLRRQVEADREAQYKAGREQGRLDPSGEAAGGNERGAPRRMTLAEIEAMPYSEWMSIPKEERDRLRADARSNQ